MNKNNDGPSNPLEWLAGGLFYGFENLKIGGEADDKVASSDDVMALLNGINENLNEIHALAAAAEANAAEKGTLGNAPEAKVEDAKEGTGKEIVADESKKDENTATESIEQQQQQQQGAAITAKGAEEEPECSRLFEARLSRLRFLLYDERRRVTSSTAPNVAGTTVQALTCEESLQQLVPNLIKNLHDIPFESRKQVAAIFNYLLVSGLVGDGEDALAYEPVMMKFRDYVAMHFDDIFVYLIRGYERNNSTTLTQQQDVGLHCGSMFRSCCRHAYLYKQLVYTSERAQKYVFPIMDEFVHDPNFEISSDAMETLRVIFTATPTITTPTSTSASAQQYELEQKDLIADYAAEFFMRDYEEVWTKRFIPKLLVKKNADNYMTRRVALQILSYVLLTRTNYNLMIKYVSEKENLKLSLLLLRDTSPHITFDAFHVFKVFVANPNKPPEIVKMLRDNKVKLCKYLETLHQDREEKDKQFADEKSFIITTIAGL